MSFSVSLKKTEADVEEILSELERRRINRSGIICDLLRAFAASGYDYDFVRLDRPRKDEPVI